MRRIVLAMMTTLNGRLDDPFAWMNGVDDDHYRDIRDAYKRFDTILVGRLTFEEMAVYWPGAETAAGGSETNRSMARMMNSYRKFVFTTDPALKTWRWSNAVPVPACDDRAIVSFVEHLKAQPGRDIHLAGGARLAQTFVRLGLVDEFRLSTYPVVSQGAKWFDAVTDTRKLTLLRIRWYGNGVTRTDYAPAGAASTAARPQTFTEMLP